MKDEKTIRMGHSIQVYLTENKLEKAKPKDLMPWLIQQGFFSFDHREGLPLRDVLREINWTNKLYLLPNLIAEKKIKNTFWTFFKIKN